MPPTRSEKQHIDRQMPGIPDPEICLLIQNPIVTPRSDAPTSRLSTVGFPPTYYSDITDLKPLLILHRPYLPCLLKVAGLEEWQTTARK